MHSRMMSGCAALDMHYMQTSCGNLSAMWIISKVNFTGWIMRSISVVMYMYGASVTSNKFEDVPPRVLRILVAIIAVYFVCQDPKSHAFDAAYANDLRSH